MYFDFERKYLFIIIVSLVAITSVAYFLARNLGSKYEGFLGRSRNDGYYEVYGQQ